MPYLRLTSRSRFEEITDEPEEAQKPESKKRPRDSDAMETDEPKLSKAQQKKLNKKLKAEDASSLSIEKKSYLSNEAAFRFDFNEETMAVHKLSEGISKFAADAITLKDILKEKINA